MISRNDPCWCNSGKKWKKCHYPAPPKRSKEEKLAAEYLKNYNIIIKNEEQITGIRNASKLAAQILDALCKKAAPGVTTEELNTLSTELHKKAGAIPAPLNYGYPPFPKGICTSINEVICHGIPNNKPLEKGDIVNIDVTSILKGYYGDTSRMVVIGGKTTPERQLVVDTAYKCLMDSIEILKPGVPLYAIGDAIEAHADKTGCSVVYQFVGHGVGVDFHEAPQVNHNSNKTAIPLAPGMTFTIEPMINAGVPDAVIDEKDQWTARTEDGKASAQWEHTILITDNGYEILTVI
jgi:methionyl aminopeptidase